MAASDVPLADLDNLIRDCADLSLSQSLKNNRFSLDDEPADPTSPGQALVGRTLITTLLYRGRVIPTQLEKTLMAARSPIWSVTMTVLEENLFLFRFEHRVNYNKVLRDRPWQFNQFLLVMKEVYKDTLLNRSVQTSILF